MSCDSMEAGQDYYGRRHRHHYDPYSYCPPHRAYPVPPMMEYEQRMPYPGQGDSHAFPPPTPYHTTQDLWPRWDRGHDESSSSSY
ncbi:hypothetical protein [Brevibacillus daliensis]|uniref:hypothetical protein n=1 Tax=Brevibacillus daliensis TaxID=2892995 RepID=UPI001E4D180A|nr:hypothetical protein [Brevibacillus daliensis]